MNIGKTSGGAALALQELKNRVEMQERRYRFSIPVFRRLTAAGTPGAQVTEVVKLSTEGDFLAKAITIKLIGRDPNTLAILDPSVFGATGLDLRMKESGWGRELFRDWTPVETLAVPGYATIIYQPLEFENLFLGGSEITFDLRNKAAVVQDLELTFHGWQFRGSFRDNVQGSVG